MKRRENTNKPTGGPPVTTADGGFGPYPAGVFIFGLTGGQGAATALLLTVRLLLWTELYLSL